MKHYGDITKLDGHNLPLVDIVTGGSPCQDLSVAGKRAGLAGERSGLFMEQVRIIKEMRDESTKQLRLRGADVNIRFIQPRYMVWKNVPGAFSSNKGEDFRCVLEETARIADKNAVIPRPENGKWTPSGCILGDGWSIAWRVHDAQFWGVPQRRKRIALVADFGGSTAPEILFERESVSGNTTESGEKGQGASTTSERDSFEAISFQERAGKPGGGKGILIQNERVGALSTLNNQSVLSVDEKMGQTYIGEEVGNTLGARDYKQPQAVCVGNGQLNQMSMDETANTLDTMHDQQAILTYGLDRASFNQGQNAQYDFSIEEETAQTLVSRGPGGGYSQTVGALCARDYKGVGNEYVSEGKCIIQSIRQSPYGQSDAYKRR